MSQPIKAKCLGNIMAGVEIPSSENHDIEIFCKQWTRMWYKVWIQVEKLMWSQADYLLALNIIISNIQNGTNIWLRNEKSSLFIRTKNLSRIHFKRCDITFNNHLKNTMRSAVSITYCIYQITSYSMLEPFIILVPWCTLHTMESVYYSWFAIHNIVNFSFN